MTKRTFQLIATGALLLFAMSAIAQTAKDSKANKSGSAPRALPAANDASYLIGPEDVLSVNVWKEPEASAPTVAVRPDGKISLPLLNDMQAAGFTPMQLMEQITEKLKKYIADPRVTVVVAGTNSRRVFILGEVARPGAFPMMADMTVLQALSAAGGLSQYANGSKIYVLRNQNGTQTRLAFNYKEVLKGQKPEQNIVLKPGDTIVVP
jgi:polysaccharide export outer membrane protein